MRQVEGNLPVDSSESVGEGISESAGPKVNRLGDK